MLENIEEEEKKSHDSSGPSEDGEGNNTCAEVTSNFAFDRFLSVGAYGYANGLIKIIRVNSASEELSID